ncbi:MAG TPA: helix-turn-helix domain-containing protein [Thermoanaerobaculia bacterium]|nr:helix-turn-helix domain-containing protein [Thermoanaerobaculia bacterium]
MLGESVREARIRKGLTQARLAKLAGVSRRHLAALEKGANVSVNILQRVAAVLELTEIQLGPLALRNGEKDNLPVNMPLLSDTIREARVEAERAQHILARAEHLLGARSEDGGAPPIDMQFPRMPIRRLEPPHLGNGESLRDRADYVEVETAGEIRHGEPVNESKKEKVAIPRAMYEQGEIVFRARGANLRDQGIEDGDLLIVELRPRGRASNGELVIGKIGRQVFVGRWWQKHGKKALMSNGLSEVTVGRVTRSLKIVAAINCVARV